MRARGRVAAFALIMPVLAAASPVAQSARDDVAAQLTVISNVKADEGFSPDQEALGRSVLFGVLEHGSSVYLELTLDRDRQYHIAARCDAGCSNLDTRMLSPEFDPVAEDTLDNDMPKVDVRPAASGRHLFAVQMTECTVARICYFGIVILSKPVQSR